jgi:uncharacterized protein (TIGR04552 family)
MTDPAERTTDPGVFLPLRAAHPRPRARLSELDLQHVHEIRLLLRGDSIVDWHRLGLHDAEGVRRLLAVNGLDVDDAGDRDRLQVLRAEAVRYIRETLGLRLDDHLVGEVSPLELPLLASGRGRYQRQACTLLKVMHIIYHLDARELRMTLPISDNDLFALVEHSVVRMFDELQAAGVPVVEFSWSRKTKDSLVTKLLVKRETSAARVFDRLRFRLIVEHGDDLLSTLHVMLQQFIPFNYVVPAQTVNTLVDTAPLQRRVARARDFCVIRAARTGLNNEFSGSGYRILNFVADLPVRVDRLLQGRDDLGHGAVVFVLAEFQIMDRDRAIQNETGESSHAQYKHRQHQRVRERLLREPRKPAALKPDDVPKK